MRYRRLIIGLSLTLVVAACREDDGLVDGSGGSRAFVTSDPAGASILIDERQTEQITPDTVGGLAGRHDISAQLDTFDATYGFNARIVFPGSDTTFNVHGPLLLRCFDPLCYRNVFRHYSANQIRFANNPVGAIFLEDGGGGEGLLWPSTTNNPYVSGGFPVIAGRMLTDTIALGPYDTNYLAGRPLPVVTQTADSVALRQTTWVLPPSTLLQFETARGFRIDEHVISTTRVDDVVAVRLVFTNITDQPLYRTVDPFIPTGGATLDDGYIGFLLDPDVGESDDDLISYDADLDMVFAYDAEFEESNFAGGYNLKPALVGLRVLEAPAGTNVVLNGWVSQLGGVSGDWRAGQSEGLGWLNLSGTRPFQPEHEDPEIGHLPPQSGDMRLSVSAGPLRLAPGDSAAITIAIFLAEPASGAYTPGVVHDPGNPTDRSRQLYAIAANLRARALAADAVMASFR
ncbi:MAG: hypothetical protein ACRELX_03175 [Longimicrobiales bacterium]